MLSVASRRPKYRVSPTTPTISYASSNLNVSPSVKRFPITVSLGQKVAGHGLIDDRDARWPFRLCGLCGRFWLFLAFVTPRYPTSLSANSVIRHRQVRNHKID